MTESSAIFRKDEVQKLLRAIRDEKISSIEPNIDYAGGVRYPSVEEITGARGKDLELALKELSDVGVLISEVRDNIAVCPICGSHRTLTKLSCATCGSLNLAKGVMIEHLGCGYLDLLEVFNNEGELVCPRCSKTLRTIGVDYRKLGAFYKCEDCQQRFSNPIRRNICSNGHSFDEKERVLHKVYAYRPDPEKRALIERETLDFKPIVDGLVQMGWFGQAPIILKGQTGIEHEFAFGLWKPGSDSAQENPKVVADAYTSLEIVGLNVVLMFFAKTIDVAVNGKILMVMPKLDEKARSLAKGCGIIVVEAETASELLKKVTKLLLDMTGEGKEEQEVQLLDFALEESRQS